MKNSFLRNTAESIVKSVGWSRLSSITLVLPSHRAGLVLSEEILNLQAEQNISALWAPTVKTLQQLQSDLSPLYEEDELMTIVRLYRHYRRLNEGDKDLMPLDMFYGWGWQMIADFTNVDASMHAEEVPNFFENTIAAHELSQLDLDEEVIARLRGLINPIDDEKAQKAADSIRNQYKKVWQQLDVLYRSLREEMIAAHKGYSGMRQRAVIEHWDDEYVQSQIKGRTYIFVGFNYLLPVERELMERLRDAGQALFYWDYAADFQANAKAFSFARLNSGILGSALPPRAWDTPREVTVTACTSREAQAQYVHSWLQANYTEKGQKVGVVICDETMLESVIYTLPEIIIPGEKEASPINITKGFPLRNTYIYTRVLSWLYDKQRGDAAQEVSPEIIDQLLAALITESEEPEEAEKTDETAGMNWQDLLIMESEYQVRKVANQMRKIIADGIGDVPFTLKLLRLLMRRTMENVTMPFHGEPVTDIQVMGVLETRMLDFDKLLILNVEEGVLPQKQPDSSFIPYYLRKAYSMQTSDERATVYAYNFFRLLSRAGHSTLLFTTADGAENSKGMSRFVMQMLVSPNEFHVHKMRLEEPSVLTQIDDERLHTSGVALRDLLEKRADGKLYRKDGSRFTLSPSALNTYIACPRKFCLQYIQGLREAEKEEIRFSPATLGSFVHNAMLYLYRDYLKCQENQAPLSPESIEQILADETLPEQALEKAYEMMNEEWAKHHKGETNHYVAEQHQPEKPVILQFVRNVLERDREDAQKGLEIQLLEEDRMSDIEIEGVGVIRTGGRIDRVDKIGTGDAQKMRIVDYKSGKYDEKKLTAAMDDIMENKDAGYIRQTLLYSEAFWAHEKSPKPTIEPNLFFCSRTLAEQKTTVTLDEQEVTDYQTIRAEFMQQLKAKIYDVLTVTEFPPCEEKECASFCPFLDLCRRKVHTFE